MTETSLEHQGVHEGLRQVPAQLTLADVVLLAVQPRRAAGGPVAFEPAGRLHLAALLVQGQGHGEAAEQERALGPAERPGLVPEAVQVAVLSQFLLQGLQGGQRAGVAGG